MPRFGPPPAVLIRHEATRVSAALARHALRTTGMVCYAVSFLPRLHLGEDREIPGVTTSAAASQMWPYSIISRKVLPIN